jgi:hypothetical protein
MVALGAGFAIGASRGEIRIYRRFGFTELIQAHLKSVNLCGTVCYR